MKKIVIGIILAALASFLWGAFYWMGPLTANTFKTQTNDNTLRQALLDNLPESGTYYVPNASSDMQEITRLQEQGPIALIHYIRDGKSANMAVPMVLGFLLNLVTALVIAVLLKIAIDKLDSYRGRLGFVALVGFVAAFFANFTGSLWWYHAPTWTTLLFIYDFTVYLVCGLVLSAFIKPE